MPSNEERRQPLKRFALGVGLAILLMGLLAIADRASGQVMETHQRGAAISPTVRASVIKMQMLTIED